MYFFFIFNFFSDFYQKRKIVVMKFFHNSINEAVLAPKMLSLAPASAALHRQCKEPTFDATTHSKTAKKPFFYIKSCVIVGQFNLIKFILIKACSSPRVGARRLRMRT